MESKAEVFVDANVFIALLNKDDALHERAVSLWVQCKNAKRHLMTANVVVSEVITVLSQRASKALALRFADTIYSRSRDIELIYADEGIETAALGYLRSWSTKNASFVDAIIVAIMKQRGIAHLASFDRIFRAMPGISVLA
ncbi:MAG: PIN domain-containing protein [Candidatus Sungiibacteriota bacterium]